VLAALAAAREADVSLLFVFLAVAAVLIGLYFLYVHQYVGAVVAVLIAILVVIFLV
jgi:hypothetical protein